MEIYRQVIQRVDDGESVALLLVVGVDGSTPQRIGAKALVDDRGSLIAGTIGGGLMEAHMAAEGPFVLRDRAPRLVTFPMDEAYGRASGPICGGTMRIFILPCSGDACEPYRLASDAVRRRGRGLLITTVTGARAGHRRWVDSVGLCGAPGPLHDRLSDLLRREAHGTVHDPSTGSEIFVETVVPPPRMLVVGGGHVGQAVARRAAQLGFDVTVLDDRPEHADASRFSEGVHAICGAIGAGVDRFPKDRDTYIILVSKGHKPDAEALEKCIGCDVAYLGMIGSGRKIALLRRDFLEKGLANEAQFDRLFAPIGFDIGAVTVEEIATSIMAQIIAVRRGVELPERLP